MGWEQGCKQIATLYAVSSQTSGNQPNSPRPRGGRDFRENALQTLCTAHSKRASWDCHGWKFFSAVKCFWPTWQTNTVFLTLFLVIVRQTKWLFTMNEALGKMIYRPQRDRTGKENPNAVNNLLRRMPLIKTLLNSQGHPERRGSQHVWNSRESYTASRGLLTTSCYFLNTGFPSPFFSSTPKESKTIF